MLHLYEDQLSNITMFAIWGIGHYLESYLMSRPIFRERILCGPPISCLSDMQIRFSYASKSKLSGLCFNDPPSHVEVTTIFVQDEYKIYTQDEYKMNTRWIQDLYTRWIHNSTNEPTIILWTKLNIQQMDTFCRTTEGRSGTNSTEMQHHNL